MGLRNAGATASCSAPVLWRFRRGAKAEVGWHRSSTRVALRKPHNAPAGLLTHQPTAFPF